MGVLALIGGGSCSGKTTFAKALAARLHDATLLRQDDYYRDLSSWPPERLAGHNFDHPDAIDAELLVADALALAAGQGVPETHYDFVTHARRHGGALIRPGEVVILEGIFALAFPRLNALAPVRVFLEADETAALDRRLRRDSAERGLTTAEIREQWAATVKPMRERHVVPTKAAATAVFDAATFEGGIAQTAAAILAEARR